MRSRPRTAAAVALGGIGLLLLTALAAGCGPALIGSGIAADRFLLGSVLLLCGGVPAAMALAREKGPRPRAAGPRQTRPPPRRRRPRTGAPP